MSIYFLFFIPYIIVATSRAHEDHLKEKPDIDT